MVAYLDHAASSPLAPGVREAMEPWLFENCANPSALHALGRKARQAVEDARERIARLLKVPAKDIIFTSGGTEANNLAIRQLSTISPHIVASSIEHDSILAPARQISASMSLVPVNSDGLIDPINVRKALCGHTSMITIMAVNNEIGTIQPLKEINQVRLEHMREYGHVFFHVDAVQAVGHIPISVSDIGCDSLSLSAHKFGGPKGIGLLYAKNADLLCPLLAGGGQEHGVRSGTENVAGIAGMATALEYAEASRYANEKRYSGLFDYFTTYLLRHFPDIRFNGSTESRTFSNINILIPGVEAEAVLLMLDLNGVYASAGSACNANGNHPSHVLKAIGLTDEEARSSLRLTMGPETTWDQMQYTANKLVQIINSLRRV